jgi:tetratricopeptide (TPR) repeat protein
MLATILQCIFVALCSEFTVHSEAVALDITQQSISSHFVDVCNEYNKAMRERRASRESLVATKQIYDRRNNRFASLIDAAEASAILSLSDEDVKALVAMSEATRKFDKALHYSQIGHQRSPGDNQASIALVRNLLNCGYREKAEAVFRELSSAKPVEDDIHSAAGLLYSSQHVIGKHDLATRHLDHFLCHFVAKISRGESFHHGVEFYLNLLKESAVAGGMVGELDQMLAAHDNALARSEQYLEECTRWLSLHNRLRLSAIKDARFRIHYSMSRQSTRDRFCNWVSYVVASSQDDGTAKLEWMQELLVIRECVEKKLIPSVSLEWVSHTVRPKLEVVSDLQSAPSQTNYAISQLRTLLMKQAIE